MLKDNAEIANVVSRALLDYSTRVQNGLVSPYRNLLESDMAVVVLTITEAGAISVAAIPEAKPTEDKIEIVTPEPCEAVGNEIKSPVFNSVDSYNADIMPAVVQPKRRRKKKVEVIS